MSRKWLDIPRLIERGYPFNFVISARQIGKTYGTIDHMREHGWTPLYLRYTEVELDVASSERGNPFHKYNVRNGTDYMIKRTTDKLRPICADGKEIGFAASLSTFSRVRGADFSVVDKIFYDEFCPPLEARRMRGETDAFANMYETINSNRELEGLPAVQVLAYSNAISLSSALLAGLDLIGPIERMIAKGIECWSDDSRGIFVMLPRLTELAEERRKTALYRMLGDNHIASQNIDNRFTNDSFFGIGRRNLREYLPAWSYEELFAYRHKSTGELYVCRSRADCMRFDRDRIEGWRRYVAPYLREDIEAGRVVYCDYTAKVKLYNMLNLPLTIA